MPTDGSDKPDVGSLDGSPEDAHSAADTSDTLEQSAVGGGKTPRIPVDLVGGLFLLAVVAVFVLNAGDDLLDWIFPLSLAYTLGIIGGYLTIRGLLGFGDKTDTLLPILRGRGVDVSVFTVLAVIYVGSARAVGFWIMTALMLFTGSVYLDPVRSRKRIALAAVIALAVCVVAYVFLLRVFYVPVPRARWLPS